MVDCSQFLELVREVPPRRNICGDGIHWIAILTERSGGIRPAAPAGRPGRAARARLGPTGGDREDRVLGRARGGDPRGDQRRSARAR